MSKALVLDYNKKGELTAIVVSILVVSTLFIFGSLQTSFTGVVRSAEEPLFFETYSQDIDLGIKENSVLDLEISEGKKSLGIVKLSGFVVGDPNVNNLKLYLRDGEGKEVILLEDEELADYKLPKRALFTITGLVSDILNFNSDEDNKGNSDANVNSNNGGNEESNEETSEESELDDTSTEKEPSSKSKKKSEEAEEESNEETKTGKQFLV